MDLKVSTLSGELVILKDLKQMMDAVIIVIIYC